MTNYPVLESCISSLPEAITAVAAGAHRLELCAGLDLDGLTPSLSLTKAVISATDVPVKVMIRPRAGHFTYDSKDRAAILEDISNMKAIGVEHFVYGSTKGGMLDLEDMASVYDHIISGGHEIKSFTIHKAIDSCHDIPGQVKALLSSDIAVKAEAGRCKLAILSSGGTYTAIEGQHIINQMNQIADGQIEIIAAGKITHTNLSEIMEMIHTPAFHGRRIVPLT